jgi:signal transduction histidine kinase
MVLQKRTSFALTAVIAFFVTVQGYLAYSSLEEQEDRLVDDIVLAETDRLVERIEAKEVHFDASGHHLRLGTGLEAWLVEQGGAAGMPPLPKDLVALPDGVHHWHGGDRIYHAMVRTIPEGRLFLRFDATRNEEFVYDFGRTLLVTGVICILLGWLMSSLLARIVVAPFRRLSERLSNWSPGERSSTTTRSDEESLLLRAFDQAQRRLEESLVREREFAANARHEVRTPLAALHTDAEMLLLTESLSEPGKERVRRMMTAVDSVSNGLESLQALSTAAAGKAEAVVLSQCVDQVWESLAHVARDAGATLVNQMPRGEIVVIDRLALMTVLRNLLRNAIDHASPGPCTVSRTVHGLEVSDEGPGIAPEDRALIFDRYFHGRLSDSPGATRTDKGLGLAIARQTAELRGWTLEVAPSAGRGSVFSLSFPKTTVASDATVAGTGSTRFR